MAGRGAELSAVFELEEGDEIRICIGQKGDVPPGKSYFGGSGGTFVVKFKVKQQSCQSVCKQNYSGLGPYSLDNRWRRWLVRGELGRQLAAKSRRRRRKLGPVRQKWQ